MSSSDPMEQASDAIESRETEGEMPERTGSSPKGSSLDEGGGGEEGVISKVGESKGVRPISGIWGGVEEVDCQSEGGEPDA